jgi:phosphatidylserine synthase
MVSTVRFRSVKAIDVGWRRSSFVLFLGAIAIALIASHPRIALVVMSYTYTLWAVTSVLIARLRRKPLAHSARLPEPPQEDRSSGAF